MLKENYLVLYRIQEDNLYNDSYKEVKGDKDLISFVNNQSRTYKDNFKILEIYNFKYKIGLEPIEIVTEYKIGTQIVV